MKLLALTLFSYKGAEAPPVALGMAAELSSFGYFQRASVREMLQFTSRTIVQRTAPGQRQTVRQEDYYMHVHVRDSGLAAVAVCDKDYPPTAAFSVAAKVMEEYAAASSGEPWRTAAADDASAQSVLEPALERYQDPVAADKLTKIQRDLDETKIVLHQTIDSVLKRGEKLDSLVDKSADLSMASQMFYKQARKTNSCCRMM
ncbi:VAMP-like protein YKT61 [Monoraphidium neglectum]|uniref:VAMP-like protein YKT61 n=1 Tax=Monoraphidium neglectum TaxID=145388 RepID=A0A0D2JPF2_9CHLO|nr:VAMP-like protein YKT61 [Monoraphidium neglectum]KIZ01023.1 VAMP-like protein YKT61 [Monoraphidium neglectum]|eukprot:XP_013900042.1 VAMP-like protein YKT61 [Monoraphidium neglectum]